ncbi:MAG: hypothetical protein JXP73_15855 [Deltaproteobacteria bacterium]|nr:hypothetical protein [Deltaproteobacteria bacterium]
MRTHGCSVLVALFALGCGGSESGNQGAGGATANGGSTSLNRGGSQGTGGRASGGTTGTPGPGTGGAAGATTPRTDGGATGGAAGSRAGTGGQTAAGGQTGTAGRATGGQTGAGGRATGGTAGSRAGTGGQTGAGGQTSVPPVDGGAIDGGATWNAGNPYGSCSAEIPARGQPVDTSVATSIIGNGTPEPCTASLLAAAVKGGGIITFDCGDAPVTIPVTETIELPNNKNTVIDGGRKIILDGGGAVQIMRFHSANYQANDATVTLQNIAFVNGKSTPTERIPERPAPCSQGWNDGEGGAFYMRDGNLTVIDSIFTNNQAAPEGPDTGGGAIYVLGSKNGVLIVGSTFIGNSGSNAGAVGCLQSELTVYNSFFQDNRATGHDANNNEPDKCEYINNGQNQTGSGGNGGAIYNDGESRNLLVCGTHVLDNAAGTKAFGGGLFFTSNNWNTGSGGTLTLMDTTMTGNTGGSWTQVQTGSITNVGTAIGTNAKSITVTNSSLQGMR